VKGKRNVELLLEAYSKFLETGMHFKHSGAVCVCVCGGRGIETLRSWCIMRTKCATGTVNASTAQRCEARVCVCEYHPHNGHPTAQSAAPAPPPLFLAQRGHLAAPHPCAYVHPHGHTHMRKTLGTHYEHSDVHPHGHTHTHTQCIYISSYLIHIHARLLCIVSLSYTYYMLTIAR
jgi:hypothetical protein